MLYDLQIQKGGHVVAREWDSDENDFIERELCPDDVILRLHDTVCLDRGITVKDIFMIMAEDEMAFSAITSCPFLEELMEEVFAPPRKNKQLDISILELSWSAYEREEEDVVGILSCYTNFFGVGDKKYELGFMAANELVMYPMFLNEDFTIKGENENVHLALKRKFTLFDVISGIVGELSYGGPPDIKAFAMSELGDAIADIKNRSIDAKNFVDGLNRHLREGKIPCSVCGEDARSPYFNKPSDICEACYKHIREN